MSGRGQGKEAGKDRLRAYREKRDPRRSGEPAGGGRRGHRQPHFVVQKHEASTLHYDFRLEAEGVLKSWAVPKEPSADPADKRLAMRPEDHPLEYERFEGTIPPGEYGAGKVEVWDAGVYDNESHDRAGEPVSVADAIERGHLTVELHGKKLRGGYSLTRMPRRGRDGWLLVKKKAGR